MCPYPSYEFSYLLWFMQDDRTGEEFEICVDRKDEKKKNEDDVILKYKRFYYMI